MRFTRHTLRVFLFVCIVGTISLLSGCGGGDSQVGPAGTLELPLVGTSRSGEVYKLTGSFHLAGETELDVSADEDVVEMELPIGAYSIRLDEGWLMSRMLPSGGSEPVASTLKSPNPTPFTIENLETTVVTFSFEIGEVDLSLGRGDLGVVIDVDDGPIDDFEDGDELVLRIAGRDGSWFPFNDGTGTQTPDPALPEPTGGEQGYALRTFGDGFGDWGAGLGASLKADNLAYDATGYVGVRFKYKSSGPVRFEFDSTAVLPPPEGTCEGSCFDGHGVTLPASEDWQSVAFQWEELEQSGFGDPVALSPAEVHSLKWLFQPPSFDFSVDDVAFVSTWPADPALAGEWSPVIPFPAIPINAHLLPTGNLLFWGTGLGSPGIFDPVGGSFSDSTLNGVEVFCSGHSFLGDGRLLVTGGQAFGINEYGLSTAYLYDATADTWTEAAEMNEGRWYPTNVTLGDGRVLTASGTIVPGLVNAEPQVYDPGTDSWETLPGAARSWSLYPMMHLAPSGVVFHTGPEPWTFFVDVSGGGSITDGPTRPASYTDYGNSVVYGEGKIIVIGGGDPPRADAEVIDLNDADPEWRSVAPMHHPRRQQNAIILADGKVLVTGGTSGSGFNNFAGGVLEPELWDPETETWEELAPQFMARTYHSVSVLLPDGRVISGGGGSPAGDNGGSENLNIEIFSPPYLFHGPRPVIDQAPARTTWGRTIGVLTANAPEIAHVNLIRHTSVTHSTNMDQRLVQPSFTVTRRGTRLGVEIPSNPNLLPPGPYLLFLVDENGVPSEGHELSIRN